MADRILVWIENTSGIGLLFRSAVWSFDLETPDEANEKFEAFEQYVIRDGGGTSVAKMGWCEGWDLDHEHHSSVQGYSYGEKMAPDSIVIREVSCTPEADVI
jgi:hypothetical protein